MPGPYSGVLNDGINSFTYDGKQYKSGEAFGPFTSCEAKAFINELSQANQDKGFAANHRRVIDQINSECPATASNAQPVNAPQGAPVEENPPGGVDNPDLQAAPNPPVSANFSETPDPSTPPSPPQGEEPHEPPAGQEDPVNNRDVPHEQTNGGDPVDLFNGAFYLEETDISIGNTILPMAFIRFYRSGSPAYGPFGWNWDHNFNLYLRELTNGNVALWRNLNEITFTFNGATFEPPSGNFEVLERLAAPAPIYEIKGKGGSLMHFERPPGWLHAERIPLLWIKDAAGNQIAFSYGPDDHLLEVRDDDDRFFRFAYDQCQLLISVEDHTGRTVAYAHDEETQQLTCVSLPAIEEHPDGIKREYHYEVPWALPELRHNIVRVTDGAGNTFLENTYEQDPASARYARVIEQLYGGYLYQYDYTLLQYVPRDPVYMNLPAQRVEVMNPDFGLETYTFNYRGELLDRRYRLIKDKSFRMVVWMYGYDDQGNLTKTVRPDGSEELQVYDNSHADPRMRGNLLRRELTAASGFPAPSRIIWRGTYEAVTQQLKEEKNESGATTRYLYDFDVTPANPANSGKLIKVIHPDVTLPDGSLQQSQTLYEYNAKGQLTATVLPDGIRHEWHYGNLAEAKSRVIKRRYDTATLQIENQVAYDAWGNIREQVDGNGHSTEYVFNALGLQQAIIHPPVNGQQAFYHIYYNSDRKPVRYENPIGSLTDPELADPFIVTRTGRDVLGYPVTYEQAANTSERRTFKRCNDYRGNPTEIAYPDGTILKMEMDERGLPLTETLKGADGASMRSKKTYDRAGKLVRETDVFGQTTLYEYDGFSRVSKITLANGTEVRQAWLENDLLASQEYSGKDRLGTIRQLALNFFEYDEKNRKVREINKVFTDDPSAAVLRTTTFFFDAMDRVQRKIHPAGGVTSYTYDGMGRVIEEEDPAGNLEAMQYDPNGNLLVKDSKHVNPDGTLSTITKRYEYDPRNRRIALIEPDGSRITSEYDDRNLLVRQTDRALRETLRTYNSYSKKTGEVWDPTGLAIQHQWEFDSMQRLLKYTDPQGQVSSYAYDTLGRTRLITYPGGFTTEKTFNDSNQIIGEALSSGTRFEYRYDSANRLVQLKNPLHPVPLKKVEDHLFEYDGLNRLTKATCGTLVAERDYDSLNRLISESNHGFELRAVYDDATGTVQKIWPDGRTETWEHNANETLERIRETTHSAMGGGITQLAAFKTSGKGMIAEASMAGGLTLTNNFDDRKRITELAYQSPSGLQQHIQYRYNRTDRKQVEAIQGAASSLYYFEYDQKYRLALAKDGFSAVIPPAATQPQHDLAISAIGAASGGAARTASFNYNNSDARLLHNDSLGGVKNYTYTPGHRMQSDGSNLFSYQVDGTLQTDGVRNYECDALGRIVAIAMGGSSLATIAYDALGRPGILQETGQPVRSFNYFGGFVEQENTNGIPTRHITVQPVTGVPIAYHDQGVTRYPLFDTRFNLIALADSAGQLLETYRYRPFGEPGIQDANGNALAQSGFGVAPVFGGQRYVASSGHYLSKKRWMDPLNGVYLSMDPKGYVDAPSLYVYAAQDPVNNIDPNGEVVPFIIAAFVIGGALAGAGYSAYDAYHNPNRYEGWQGSLRVLGNVFGGAAIGGVAIIGGEAILAVGGTGLFATGASTTTLTASQAFVLYGSSSVVSGGVLRGGFNQLFPEYVDPVSARSVTIDFVAGGAIGTGLRAVTNYVTSPGFGTFPGVPAGSGKFAQWFRFGADAGGEEVITGSLGAYPGRIGQWLDKIGIRQGYQSTVNNFDAGGNIFARVDTGAHEGFHALVSRYLPTFKNLSSTGSLGAIARYPEEVVAYAIGHGAAGRIHGIPFAPFEAINSLSAFGPAQVEAAKIFWGRVTGATGVALAEQYFGEENTHPNVKPPNSK